MEVEILDAKSAAFHDSHPRTVHQPTEQRHRARWQFLEQASDFLHAQDDGKTLWSLGPDGVNFKFGFQDIPKQEEEGGEGLILGAGGDLSLHGEMGQKGVDLAVSHFGGMDPATGELAMKAKESLHPIEISRFSPNGEVLGPHQLAGLFEQGRPMRARGGRLRHKGLSRLRLYSSQQSSGYPAIPVQKG